MSTFLTAPRGGSEMGETVNEGNERVKGWGKEGEREMEGKLKDMRKV